MHKAREEDDSERSSVVFQKDSNMVMEETAPSQFSTDVCHHEDKEGNHYGQVERLFRAKPGKNLNAFLEVDEGNVEPKYVTRKPCDIA